MSHEMEIPETLARLTQSLADDDAQRRQREDRREQAARRREEKQAWREANPPAPVARLLSTYRAWHAAAMTLPWLREQVEERPMSVVPYGLEGVRLGEYTLGPFAKSGRAEATLELARAPELRFSYWRVGYLCAMSGGHHLTPVASLLTFSPETIEALTRYFAGGVWADLVAKLERLESRTTARRNKRD